jgi:hypothetical protein
MSSRSSFTIFRCSSIVRRSGLTCNRRARYRAVNDNAENNHVCGYHTRTTKSCSSDLIGHTHICHSNTDTASSDLPQCSVCLCDMDEKTKYVTQCNHEFHRACLKSWTDLHHTSCPLCRADVLTHNLEERASSTLDVMYMSSSSLSSSSLSRRRVPPRHNIRFPAQSPPPSPHYSRRSVQTRPHDGATSDASAHNLERGGSDASAHNLERGGSDASFQNRIRRTHLRTSLFNLFERIYHENIEL